jgi:carboxymethylenebutenolidase
MKNQEELNEQTSTLERDPALDPTLDHLSRRAFLGRAGAGTATILTTTALGADAQDAEKKHALDDPNIEKKNITYRATVGDKTADIKGFLAQPKGDAKRGSIIVVQEIFGLNEHIRDLAARFAQAGFNALAPDFFTREGGPPALEGGNFQPLMEFVGKIPDRQMMADVKGAAEYLRGLPTSNKKVGIVGFCWGGRVVMLSSAEVPELDAAVAYYGRVSSAKTANQPAHPLDLVDKMRVPLMGHFGAEDRGIPVADVEKLRDQLKERARKVEIYIYDKAGHAFNNDTRPSYQAEAAKLAWQRTLDWFKKHLSA